MKEQTMTANTIDNITTAKIKCDEACKKLFGITEIAAYIMKYVCREYRDLSMSQIMDCLKEKPLISEVNVNDYEGFNSEEVTKLNSEVSTVEYGTVTFDVLIKALVPYTTDDIHIYVNYEGQMDYKQPRTYKRGQYYTAKELSLQYGTEFSHGEYEKLKKVYSIWICFNPSKADKNTITSYSLAKNSIYGNASDYTDYNLTELIYVCLGNEDSPNKLLGMLNTLFSKKITKETKKKLLQEKYDLTMTREIEKEADDMCNYSDYVEQSAMKIGMEKGIEKGIEKGMEKGIRAAREDAINKLIAKGFDELFIIDLGYTKEEYEEAVGMKNMAA